MIEKSFTNGFLLCLPLSPPKQMKENAESLKTLNEQLQSKEVELLQLRTEVETQQGTRLDTSSWCMLTSPSGYIRMWGREEV